jgi:hypothetical protein
MNLTLRTVHRGGASIQLEGSVGSEYDQARRLMKSFAIASGAVVCGLLSASIEPSSAQALNVASRERATAQSHHQVTPSSLLGRQSRTSALLTGSARPPNPVVWGNSAVLRNGIAYAPSNAPDSVKSAIWAVNTICQKPFLMGGGHRSFSAAGYDCSGAVSFALHHAGLLKDPLVARELMRYGDPGRGRWITILVNREHAYMIIAGLRLDTTDFRFGGRAGPRWHEYLRLGIGFEVRHPVGL